MYNLYQNVTIKQKAVEVNIFFVMAYVYKTNCMNIFYFAWS